MSTATLPQSRPARFDLSRLVRTGLLIGIVDGCWAIVLTLIYGRPVARLWQGIAATVFGERMFDGGAATVALGVAMHFGVAFAWTACSSCSSCAPLTCAACSAPATGR